MNIFAAILDLLFGHQRPAPVVAQPRVEQSGVAVVVRDPQGRPVGGATIDTGKGLFLTNADGYVWLGTVVRHRVVAFSVRASGYVEKSVEALIHDLNQDVVVELTPTFRPLPRLVVRGQFLGLETGERWTGIGCSDFFLLGRYLAGEDIRPVLEQRASLGFNWLRVFTAIDVPGIGRLVPREHVDYYDRLNTFADLLARYGLYVELVGFTGPYQTLFTNDDEKVAHWDQLNHIVYGTNVTLELVNEGDHAANRDIPFDRLKRPAGVLSSHGSGAADHLPAQPLWDYATYHPGFGDEWHRKVGHNAAEDVAWKTGVPTVSNETTRCPDHDDNPDHFYDAAAGAALLCAGATFHSVNGKCSQRWAGRELECAQVWAAGAKSVPLEFQDGRYERTVDDRFLRVYHKVLPDGRRHTVEIRR